MEVSNKTTKISPLVPEIISEVGASSEEEDQNIRNAKINNDNLEQDRILRKHCAYATLWGTAVWLLCVLEIIFLEGVHICVLSNSVLITLLTTTTANVLGGLWIIYNYLFPNEK